MGGWGKLNPLPLLSCPLPCPDRDTVQGLRQLEDIAARNGMWGGGGGGDSVGRARKPGSCPASATDHCGMWEENWAPVSPQELKGQPGFLLPHVGGKPSDSWRAGEGPEKRLVTCYRAAPCLSLATCKMGIISALRAESCAALRRPLVSIQ